MRRLDDILAVRFPKGKAFVEITERRILVFFNKVKITEPGKCWEWIGHKTKAGYGNFSSGLVEFYAHRLAYFLSNWEINDDLEVCHSCDNPACCNPDHLWQGTHCANVQDMFKKGRGKVHGVATEKIKRGELAPNAKRTNAQILEIRARYAEGGVKQEDLGLEYGISGAMVSRIVNRKIWAHVE